VNYDLQAFYGSFSDHLNFDSAEERVLLNTITDVALNELGVMEVAIVESEYAGESRTRSVALSEAVLRRDWDAMMRQIRSHWLAEPESRARIENSIETFAEINGIDLVSMGLTGKGFMRAVARNPETVVQTLAFHSSDSGFSPVDIAREDIEQSKELFKSKMVALGVENRQNLPRRSAGQNLFPNSEGNPTTDVVNPSSRYSKFSDVKLYETYGSKLRIYSTVVNSLENACALCGLDTIEQTAHVNEVLRRAVDDIVNGRGPDALRDIPAEYRAPINLALSTKSIDLRALDYWATHGVDKSVVKSPSVTGRFTGSLASPSIPAIKALATVSARLGFEAHPRLERAFQLILQDDYADGLRELSAAYEIPQVIHQVSQAVVAVHDSLKQYREDIEDNYQSPMIHGVVNTLSGIHQMAPIAARDLSEAERRALGVLNLARDAGTEYEQRERTEDVSRGRGLSSDFRGTTNATDYEAVREHARQVLHNDNNLSYAEATALGRFSDPSFTPDDFLAFINRSFNSGVEPSSDFASLIGGYGNMRSLQKSLSPDAAPGAVTRADTFAQIAVRSALLMAKNIFVAVARKAGLGDAEVISNYHDPDEIIRFLRSDRARNLVERYSDIFKAEESIDIPFLTGVRYGELRQRGDDEQSIISDIMASDWDYEGLVDAHRFANANELEDRSRKAGQRTNKALHYGRDTESNQDDAMRVSDRLMLAYLQAREAVKADDSIDPAERQKSYTELTKLINYAAMQDWDNLQEHRLDSPAGSPYEDYHSGVTYNALQEALRYDGMTPEQLWLTTPDGLPSHYGDLLRSREQVTAIPSYVQRRLAVPVDLSKQAPPDEAWEKFLSSDGHGEMEFLVNQAVVKVKKQDNLTDPIGYSGESMLSRLESVGIDGPVALIQKLGLIGSDGETFQNPHYDEPGHPYYKKLPTIGIEFSSTSFSMSALGALKKTISENGQKEDIYGVIKLSGADFDADGESSLGLLENHPKKAALAGPFALNMALFAREMGSHGVTTMPAGSFSHFNPNGSDHNGYKTWPTMGFNLVMEHDQENAGHWVDDEMTYPENGQGKWTMIPLRPKDWDEIAAFSRANPDEKNMAFRRSVYKSIVDFYDEGVSIYENVFSSFAEDELVEWMFGDDQDEYDSFVTTLDELRNAVEAGRKYLEENWDNLDNISDEKILHRLNYTFLRSRAAENASELTNWTSSMYDSYQRYLAVSLDNWENIESATDECFGDWLHEVVTNGKNDVPGMTWTMKDVWQQSAWESHGKGPIDMRFPRNERGTRPYDLLDLYGKRRTPARDWWLRWGKTFNGYMDFSDPRATRMIDAQQRRNAKRQRMAAAPSFMEALATIGVEGIMEALGVVPSDIAPDATFDSLTLLDFIYTNATAQD
jgi:hypothetical protein